MSFMEKRKKAEGEGQQMKGIEGRFLSDCYYLVKDTWITTVISLTLTMN